MVQSAFPVNSRLSSMPLQYMVLQIVIVQPVVSRVILIFKKVASCLLQSASRFKLKLNYRSNLRGKKNVERFSLLQAREFPH